MRRCLTTGLAVMVVGASLLLSGCGSAFFYDLSDQLERIARDLDDDERGPEHFLDDLFDED